MTTIVPIIQTDIPVSSYTVNNISMKKISLIIDEKTLYLNVSINYVQKYINGDGNTVTTDIISNKVAPIYIYSVEFDNMINSQKLNNIIAGLAGLQIATTPPIVSKYKYKIFN